MCSSKVVTTLALGLLACGQALAETPWEVHVRLGLTGTWTASCAVPPSVPNMWYVWSEGANGTILRVSYRGPGTPPAGYTVVIEHTVGRMRVLESTRDNGKVLAKEGVNIGSGQPTRWLEKCARAAPPGIPISPRVTNEDLKLCWSKGTDVPAQARVQNCSGVIERGEWEGLSRDVLAVVYSNRGIAYHALQRADAAIGDYTRAIALKPDLAEAYYNRANAYGEKQLYDKAIADYSAAIRLAPDAPTYVNRAWTYEKMGRAELAIADYRVALALDPHDDHAIAALERLGAGR